MSLNDFAWSSTLIMSAFDRKTAARCFTALSREREAIAILRGKYDRLPQPAGDLALALAHEAAGDTVDAAARYQLVFYGYPLAEEAANARDGISRLTAKFPAKSTSTM